MIKGYAVKDNIKQTSRKNPIGKSYGCFFKEQRNTLLD